MEITAETTEKVELFEQYAEHLDVNQWRTIFKNIARMKPHQRTKVRKEYTNNLSEGQ